MDRSRFSLLFLIAFSMGLSQVAGFNCTSITWRKQIASGYGPLNISSHSMTWDYDEKMYVFGGVHEDYRNEELSFKNVLYEYDIPTDAWTILDDGKGEGPDERALHGAAYNGHLYVYGGTSYYWGYTSMDVKSDFWRWDSVGSKWDALDASPGARAAIQLVANGDFIYLFGGYVDDQYTMKNDIWRYDVTQDEWTLMIADGNASSPAQRAFHHFRGNPAFDFILMTGGRLTTGQIVGDTWIYLTDQNRWIDRTIFVTDYPNPPVLDVAGDVFSTYFVFYGGQKGDSGITSCNAPYAQNPSNATYLFETLDESWDEYDDIFNNNPLPLVKDAGNLVYIDDRLLFFMYGGYAFDAYPVCQRWNNDMWCIELFA